MRKIALMEPGATVAVFGLGTVGLSVSVEFRLSFHEWDTLDHSSIFLKRFRVRFIAYFSDYRSALKESVLGDFAGCERGKVARCFSHNWS